MKVDANGSCCVVSAAYAGAIDRCPACGARGLPVDLATVKALVRERALARLEPVPHRFCRAADCRVVYFDEGGRAFERGDVRVPVWQKEPPGQRVICYCFGENEADVAREIGREGRSAAVGRVRAHIEAGRCACEVRNPAGRCCLGDLTTAVSRARAGRPAMADRESEVAG